MAWRQRIAFCMYTYIYKVEESRDERKLNPPAGLCVLFSIMPLLTFFNLSFTRHQFYSSFYNPFTVILKSNFSCSPLLRYPHFISSSFPSYLQFSYMYIYVLREPLHSPLKTWFIIGYSSTISYTRFIDHRLIYLPIDINILFMRFLFLIFVKLSVLSQIIRSNR